MQFPNRLITAFQVGVVALLLPCSASVLAHHSLAAFDPSQVITFEGTVHRLDWKNPHMYLVVETLDDSGEPILQQIEGLAITQALVAGFDKEAFVPGSRVVVRANPNRGGAGRTVRGLTITMEDGSVQPMYERSPEIQLLVPAEGLAGNWAPAMAETDRLFGVIRGWPFTDAARNRPLDAGCVIEPVPFLTMINELRVIEVHENSVIMRHDNSGDFADRIIHLDQAAHPADVQPSRFGHAIGRWEEDTLVIDTVGYTPDDNGLFVGIPGSAQKHTVERLGLTEDRRRLRYEFWVEDPEFLAEPVSFSMVWDHRPDLMLSTEPCDPEVSDRYLIDQ